MSSKKVKKGQPGARANDRAEPRRGSSVTLVKTMTTDEALARIRDADLPDYFERTVESVNSVSCFGDMPLHIAAIWGDVEMVKALIAGNAPLDVCGEEQMTPLHYAIEHGKLECARILIAAGASLEITERLGLTAAELAAMNEDPSIKNLFAT
jgi:uncharacterized protein